MPVAVALIQLEVSDGEPVPERIERAIGLTAAEARTADLVVLPELWHTGAFALDAVSRHAQPLDGDLVTRLRGVAAEAGVWIHGGSFAERTQDGRVFNTSVVLDPSGDVAAVYRKIHLFGFDEGEAAVLSAGTQVVTVPTPLGVTGLATCYDLRFPELFRALTDRDATAVVIPSGWPQRRIAHWTLLARARAVENQTFVLACNTAGTHAGVEMGGRSLIIDPQGTVLAEAGMQEQVLRAEIDPDQVDQWRAAFPVLADRVLGRPARRES